MGRPRKPAHLMAAKGAWRHDAQRRRTDAETKRALDGAKPPKGFKREEVELWKELIADAPINTLRNSDKLIVEQTARVLARLHYMEHFNVTTTQFIQLTGSARALLSLLGMSPADRSRVSSSEEPTAYDPNNDFSDFR